MRPSGVRSFVRRGARATAAQRRALEKWGGVYCVSLPADWSAVFGRRAPLVAEIGCGYGEATVAFARRFPERNFVAFEVYTPAIGALLNHLAGDGENTSSAEKKPPVGNVRVVCGDAAEKMPPAFADGELTALHLFFPDPWRKRRHRKRRLVTPSFADLAARKLACDGVFYMTTDWRDYAESADAMFSAHADFTTMESEERMFYKNTRPPTRFQRRAEQENRRTADILFRRRRRGATAIKAGCTTC